VKLPDFKKFERLNSLRTRMGISPNTFGEMKTIVIKASSMSYDELKALSTVGIEVELDQVSVLADGTLAYKDKRVLLHIRDVSDHGRSYSDPRFHFANCETLRKMRSNNRFDRYVVATNDSGVFRLFFSSTRKEVPKKLDVCQNCLEFFSYNGFLGTDEQFQRKRAVNSFSISEFFEKYPKSLHAEVPRYTDKTAPRNEYTSDFEVVSRQIKVNRGWQCEAPGCGIVLSDPQHRRYLHAHHVNGLKYDNANGNLKLYCVHCHSNQFQHSHMKPMANDALFQLIRNQLLAKVR
jgi:hypothetical protein